VSSKPVQRIGCNERDPGSSQTPEGNLRIAANIVFGQSLAAHTHNALEGVSRSA
jgi:hypothetical protein